MTPKEARRRRDAFSARGSACPICRRPFRNCGHTIAEARDRLNADIGLAEVAASAARESRANVYLDPAVRARLEAFAPAHPAPGPLAGKRTLTTLLPEVDRLLALAGEASGLPPADVLPWLVRLLVSTTAGKRIPLRRLAELAPELARPMMVAAWGMATRARGGEEYAAAQLRVSVKDWRAAVAAVPGLAAEFAASEGSAL